MNHSNKHEHFSKLTADEMSGEHHACNDKVAAGTGVAADAVPRAVRRILTTTLSVPLRPWACTRFNGTWITL
jgi:hypothetical protein